MTLALALYKRCVSDVASWKLSSVFVFCVSLPVCAPRTPLLTPLLAQRELAAASREQLLAGGRIVQSFEGEPNCAAFRQAIDVARMLPYQLLRSSPGRALMR